MKYVSLLWGRKTWLATINAVLDLYIPVLFFSVMITLVSLLLSVAILVITIVPMAWLIFITAQGFAAVERGRIGTFTGVRVLPPHRRLTGNWLNRLWQRTKSPTSWLEVVYSLVYWVPALIGGTIVVTLWSATVVAFALPLLNRPRLDFFLFTLTGPARWWCWLFAAVGLVISPLAARGWAWVDANVVKFMLGSNRETELEARVEELTSSRAIAIEAAEQERRRIERDLHDGAQQRLVALSITLGRAKAKFDSEPEVARVLLDEAHGEAKAAIVELRDLARGIHPVALADRGLEGAVSGLAARSVIPVEVRSHLTRRPAAAIEGIAYFVISECLTNVTKHAHATNVVVELQESADELVVTIEDNGRGGASVEQGTGLIGLRNRVTAVDGEFLLASPSGGPTTITARLPLTPEVTA